MNFIGTAKRKYSGGLGLKPGALFQRCQWSNASSKKITISLITYKGNVGYIKLFPLIRSVGKRQHVPFIPYTLFQAWDNRVHTASGFLYLIVLPVKQAERTTYENQENAARQERYLQII